MRSKYVGLLALLVLSVPVSAADLPTAHTTAGAVVGSSAGKGIVTFKGIPFAAPPVGPLRWRPPQPPVPWQGVRDASHFGDDCMQTPYVIPTGQSASEDCLTVSILTSSDYAKSRRPVMVYIYGGAFIGGSAGYPLYDGGKLAQQGVIVVGFNYRVGIFGFLAHPQLTAESPEHASGNYGLLDQIAALKWVKANIAAFGGDPARVTVFGESAGAVSIAVLLSSPLAQDLFQQAIIQSPTLPLLANLREAEKSGATVDADLATLRKRSAAELLKENDRFFPAPPGRRAGDVSFPAPVIDGYVVPVQPRTVYQEGKLNAVPTIVGVNEDEGRMFAGEGATAAASAALGDAMFVESARFIARSISKRQPRTFAYVFTRSVNGRSVPPTHSEEMAFMFGSLDKPSFIQHPAPDPQDWQLSATMIRQWTRFAATGEPNGVGLPKWPRYDAASDPYLELGTTLKAGKAFHKAQLDALERKAQ
jgi:para-nitrobenzyl esterase